MTRPERADTARLEALLLHQLQSAWEDLNETPFRYALKQPVFAVSDGASRLGCWHRRKRTIELSRELVYEQPWGYVVEVLKHEMAHQYVDEVLRAVDESAHGPAFRATCERFGIDASASGLPELSPVPDKVLSRIQKLLALAESPNEAEAQAAMNAAHRWMLKHNIEVAPTSGYAFRYVGTPKTRISVAEKVLAGLLTHHFFVKAIWVPAYVPAEGRTGRILELCGTAANLDIAAYVHGYLLETAARLWRTHRVAQRLGSDRERGTYVAGVMSGFHEKLGEQAAACRQEGLVWVGDAKLDEFYGKRWPRTRRTRASVRATEAWQDGFDAGQQIVLRRAVQSEPGARGRLLDTKR